MQDAPKERLTRRPVHRPWWALDARRVLVLALFLALFAMSARETRDPDLWWHLATGRYIVETRSIPHHDVFSYTVPDHEWITHEWLAQVGLYGLYRSGGLLALLLATSAVVTLTFVLVYVQCDGHGRQRARSNLAVFIVLLGALASAVTWGPRPQMLTMCLAAAFTYLLQRYRAGRRWVLWLYPVLTALWVNLHSGFFLGLALIGLVLLLEWTTHLANQRSPETLTPRQIGALALALGASVLAALLNPNGFRILTYPFETLGSGAMQRYIQEWASPDFHRPEYWPLALLLLGGAANLALSARRRSLTDVGLFCAFGLAALHAARHVPLFAVVVTPIVTGYLANRPPPQPSPGFAGEGERVAPPRPPPTAADVDIGGRLSGEGASLPSQKPEGKILPAPGRRQDALPRRNGGGLGRGRDALPRPDGGELGRGQDALPHPDRGGLGRGRPSLPLLLLNWTLVLLLALGTGARVAWVLRDNQDVEAAHYPVAALDHIEANGLAEKRMYNSYNWGGYLLWRGYPVFIDGRADVYGDAFMDEYVLAYQLRGDWRRPLERQKVEYILIESGASLEALLEESDEWRRAYRDELAVVFVRRDRPDG